MAAAGSIRIGKSKVIRVLRTIPEVVRIGRMRGDQK